LPDVPGKVPNVDGLAAHGPYFSASCLCLANSLTIFS
jgi:hypothetical protein